MEEFRKVGVTAVDEAISRRHITLIISGIFNQTEHTIMD